MGITGSRYNSNIRKCQKKGRNNAMDKYLNEYHKYRASEMGISKRSITVRYKLLSDKLSVTGIYSLKKGDMI
jgi:hypothetical protein